MSAVLDQNSARHWPDVLGSGDLLLFVASSRFMAALAEEKIYAEVGGRVSILEPLPAGLPRSEARTYFWVDGERHRAAVMDYDASGFVDAVECEGCGRVSYDIAKTNARRQGDPPAPIVFDYDPASGLDLFTTDMTPLTFFCTERVLECAKRHRLINLAFRPVEEGAISRPITY